MKKSVPTSSRSNESADTPAGHIGSVVRVSGPLVSARCSGAVMGAQVLVGTDGVVGEVVQLRGELATFQMYEGTELIRPGDPVRSSGERLSVELGPGLLGGVFDGIQRPLASLHSQTGDWIRRGVSPVALDRERRWGFEPALEPGTEVRGGEVLGRVEETPLIEHRVLVPPGLNGELLEVRSAGDYTVDTVVARVRSSGSDHNLRMYQKWPVRTQRPVAARHRLSVPLITGQRVLDMLFPLAKGGVAAVPGPFGAGKTIVEHQLARWSDADVIVFVGCGERGNEMVDLLEQFSELTDPHTGRPLLERSVLIANTSNMPVTAREASVYTGITVAEYFRDQGYDVALMADSTSRWAEALREVAGRLEELPAEEGHPAYLGSRLAAFYERAGSVRTLGGTDGSVTVIGSVSPPGGDFSEPVTRHTRGVVGAFWALSKSLADARHYPAIDWDESFSDYTDTMSDWWEEQFEDEWRTAHDSMLRLLHEGERESETMDRLVALPHGTLGLLREADALRQIASIIGPAALSDQQQWTFYAANLVKEGFLQQNALDPVDTFCSPRKQILLGALFIGVYHRGKRLIEQGVPTRRLLATVTSLARLKRARTEIPNDRPEMIHALHDDLEREFAQAGEGEQ